MHTLLLSYFCTLLSRWKKDENRKIVQKKGKQVLEFLAIKRNAKWEMRLVRFGVFSSSPPLLNCINWVTRSLRELSINKPRFFQGIVLSLTVSLQRSSKIRKRYISCLSIATKTNCICPFRLCYGYVLRRNNFKKKIVVGYLSNRTHFLWYGLTSVITHARCWENTRKACKLSAEGYKLLSSSSIREFWNSVIRSGEQRFLWEKGQVSKLFCSWAFPKSLFVLSMAQGLDDFFVWVY